MNPARASRLIPALLPLLLGSCASDVFQQMSRPPINRNYPTRGIIADEALEFISYGKTTQEDVLLRLGEPECFLADRNIFVYWWVANGAARILGETYLLIAFDADDKVLGHRAFRVVTYQVLAHAGETRPRKLFDPEKLLSSWEKSSD